MKRRDPQQTFAFLRWGGKRKGAGRRPKGERAGVSHATRARLAARFPVHVTVRLKKGLPSLRRKSAHRVLGRAFAAGGERFGFRLIHYSIQSNHIHLLAEAEDRRALSISQYEFFNRERHSGFALTQAGQMPDGTILVQSEMGPSILDPGRGTETVRALWPIFPATTSLQLGGATHRVHLSPTGSRITPYPLPDGRFLLSATLPGARDIAIYVCEHTWVTIYAPTVFVIKGVR